jgi:hypothetical protein
VLILYDFGLKPLPAAGPEDFYEVVTPESEFGWRNVKALTELMVQCRCTVKA